MGRDQIFGSSHGGGGGVQAVQEMTAPCRWQKAATETTAAEESAAGNLRQGVALVISRWRAMQMAVQNEWGGKDSGRKYEQLVYDVLSWLGQTREAVSLEDLENYLYESMLLSFNTEIEDGSIEEVAERLMILHEDYLNGIHA